VGATKSRRRRGFEAPFSNIGDVLTIEDGTLVVKDQ
jgi:hypothetical protein